MAEGAVFFGVQKFLDFLNRESKRLHGVDEKVADLTCQMTALQSFLKDVEAMKYESERLRNLLEDVKDVIDDAKATFESYILKECSGEEKGIMTCVKIRSCFLLNRREVATDIEDITKRISQLVARMHDFGIIDGVCSLSVQARQRVQREMLQTFPEISENNLVGVERSVDKLVDHLVNSDNIQVVSISGMGGIGKTTLAKQVFQHANVRRHFKGFSWIYVSQEFTQKDIWQRLLQALVRSDDGDVKQMDEGTLQGKLFHLFETSRYLIVLDDVWNDEAWDRIKAVFPLKGGCKVILTTRNEGVGLHADPACLSFRPQILTREESWQLCKSIVFRGKHATESVVDEEELEAIGKKILRHCGGLPLAVKVLGGLLAKKPTVSEWEKVCDNVAGESGLDEKKLNSVYRVLSLSYEDLPMHLKRCFLYLAHFPKDYNIDLEKLFLCWSADEIITSFKNGKTIRESGQEYLEELVTRNMVTVAKSNSSWETHFPKDYKMDVEKLFTNWAAEEMIKSVCNGATIQESKEDYFEELVRRNMVTTVNSYSSWGSGYCQMHDIMRGLCLTKANEENFVHVIRARTSKTTINAHIPSRSRRLVVHGDGALQILGRKKNTKVRSILCFGAEGNFWKLSARGFRCLPLLRMLDLNGAKFKEEKIPSSIGKLIHLRFLSLRGACVSQIPHSLGNLKFLLYLNLCVSQVVHVPNILKEMLELRYLLLPAFMDDKTNLELANLVKLETLWYFSTKHISVTDLLHMPKLRTLRVYLNKRCTAETLSSSLRELRKLEQFTLVEKLHVYNGGDIVRDCPHLKSLTLVMHMPRFLQLPLSLAHICLQFCRMEEDPMPILGKLLHLESVDLSDGCFIGRKMVCLESGFPKLCALQISNQKELEEWIVEEGSMPCLRTLAIKKCEKLKELPDGLKSITSLKELKIQKMNKEWTKILQPDGENYYKVQHIPDVQFINCDGE